MGPSDWFARVDTSLLFAKVPWLFSIPEPAALAGNACDLRFLPDSSHAGAGRAGLLLSD